METFGHHSDRKVEDVGSPAFPRFEPLEHRFVESTELPVEVFRLAENRRCPRQLALGVNEVCWVERSTTVVALISPGMFVAAVWTGAIDIAVGKKPLGTLIEVLLRHLPVEVSVLEESHEERLHNALVRVRTRRRE